MSFTHSLIFPVLGSILGTREKGKGANKIEKYLSLMEFNFSEGNRQ